MTIINIIRYTYLAGGIRHKAETRVVRNRKVTKVGAQRIICRICPISTFILE